jgi:hypothetical protein
LRLPLELGSMTTEPMPLPLQTLVLPWPRRVIATGRPPSRLNVPLKEAQEIVTVWA